MSQGKPEPHPGEKQEWRAFAGTRFICWRAANSVFGIVVLWALALCASSRTLHAQSTQDVQVAQEQVSEVERERYIDALTYCRWLVPRPLALRDDKRVLCLDGQNYSEEDISLANDLEQGGLFVVRSLGGKTLATIQLANILLSKQATVVINDYCLGNCANYLFIASLKTYVPKGSLVAWRLVSEPGDCVRFSTARTYGPQRLDIGPCDFPFHDDSRNGNLEQIKRKFYEGRTLSSEQPPESSAIRRALKSRIDSIGGVPQVYWTWNPRFHAGVIKTKIIYEAYPQSQDEVDAIAARIRLGERVIYDP
jgi:hypothetical protein